MADTTPPFTWGVLLQLISVKVKVKRNNFKKGKI